jgi:hypothetical protein
MPKAMVIWTNDPSGDREQADCELSLTYKDAMSDAVEESKSTQQHCFLLNCANHYQVNRLRQYQARPLPRATGTTQS